MVRNTAREIAIHLSYELSFTDKPVEEYIAKYAKGWNFARIPLVASAIMRVAMYEILYMPDIPHGASINEAVEIAKKYETPETVKFINGILGTFVRRETAE